ncbi:MAG: pectate lyase [Bacteroidetes bacterium]|nr:pectate lyase [Bacteroidota bacterium]
MKYFVGLACLIGSVAAVAQAPLHDEIADNMLVYQRSVGGWPKHIGNVPVDYRKKLTPAEKAAFIDDAGMNDATIDNNATSKEIRYLAGAWVKTKNTDYLKAAERGVRYLLTMQYKNGGFPQFYPDKSLYRNEVTYNDNAMINALNVLDDVAGGRGGMEVVDAVLRGPAAEAVSRGVGCILRTQVRVNGKLTAWCAQYDAETLQPAKARAYELPSLSGDETVGIVEFLMRRPNPSAEVQAAVKAAVEWLHSVEIVGYEFAFVSDAAQEGGRDRVFRAAPGSVIWARFYDIGTNKPFFCGRDGVKKATVAEIEHERRVGYAWYGGWARQLLDKEYPAWLEGLPIVISGAAYKSAGSIVVDASGHGDFVTVQAAINSLPAEGQGAGTAAAPRRIFIRKGVYREKIFIEKDNIVFEGEDKAGTVITLSLARDDWRKEHADDWGVATVNLRGSDITFRNLTIQNTYGFESAVNREGHQMALRSFQTTRLKVINCILKAYGGDTVSPWNVGAGMYYFKDCVMEGGVDFYCPRGWAYAEHCSFVADSGPACIWHDGSEDSDSRTVLVDCSFSGYDGFKLGRYHKDAQFYLIRCKFASNMADQDIYLVKTDNKIQWGRRVYYYDCHKEGKEYGWYRNNLAQAPGAPSADGVNADWVFHGKWNPLK